MERMEKNFIYNATYQVLILLIPFLTTPYLARTIGVKGVGIYSYTYSIVNYFMMFALLGMNTYGNREISKISDNNEKLNKTFSSIYFLQVILTVCVSLIYIMYILFFNKEYMLINIIQILYVVSVAFDINWFFCGMQEFKITVTRSGIIKIITFLLIITFVKNENDLWKYILILAMSTFLNQLILWFFINGRVKIVKVKMKDIVKHIKPTLILFIPVIATSVFKIMDKIMIGRIISVNEVGYYENAEKMLNIILSLVSALGTVTLPQMTYLFANKEMKKYNIILSKSLEFVLFIVFPVIFGFWAISDDLINIYLGSAFFKTSVLLNILAISLLFTPIANIIRMQILIPQSKDREYIIAVILGAIFNFLFNIILINKFDSIGAAIATVIAEFIVFLIEYLFTMQYIEVKKIISQMLRFCISAMVMYIIIGAIAKKIDNIYLRLTIEILIGGIVYISLNYKYIYMYIKEKIQHSNVH